MPLLIKIVNILLLCNILQFISNFNLNITYLTLIALKLKILFFQRWEK